jgi:hypothetical protein
MVEDFGLLVSAIRRVFPASRFEPVAESDLVAIRSKYPSVPEHYLAFLRHVGYGSLGDGNFMVYSGPCEPNEFFPPETAANLEGIIFFGDNFAGWMVGFDTRDGWRIVGVDGTSPETYPEEALTVGDFVAKRIGDRE